MATRTGNRYQSRKRLPDGTRLAGYGRTPEEADADLRAKLAEHESILSTVPKRATLHDLAIADWYPTLLALKPLSLKKYEGVYVNWVRARLGHIEPAELTKAHVQRLVNECAAATSTSTAKFVRSVVHQLVECAVERGMVPRNVVKSVKLPAAKPKRERVITVEAGASLLEAMQDTPVALPVFLALVLGLRLGEIAGLKWCDLDRQTGVLRIVRQRQAVRPHGVIEADLKTTGSRRAMHLPAEIVAHIDKLGDLDSEYITTYRMEPWVPDTISEKWGKYKPAEFAAWTFHDLRHGAAGLLYAMGHNLVTIARILGHQRPDMTLVYTDAHEDSVTSAMEGMRALLGRQPST